MAYTFVMSDRIANQNGSLILDNRIEVLAGPKQITSVELNNSSYSVDVGAISNIKRFTLVTTGEVNLIITIDGVSTTIVCDGFFSLSTSNAFWSTIDSIVITEVNLETITASVYIIGEKIVVA